MEAAVPNEQGSRVQAASGRLEIPDIHSPVLDMEPDRVFPVNIRHKAHSGRISIAQIKIMGFHRKVTNFGAPIVPAVISLRGKMLYGVRFIRNRLQACTFTKTRTVPEFYLSM